MLDGVKMKNYTKVVLMIVLAVLLMSSLSTIASASGEISPPELPPFANWNGDWNTMSNAIMSSANLQSYSFSIIAFAQSVYGLGGLGSLSNNWNILGRDLNHHHGKYKAAIQCYDIAIALRPDFSEAYYNKGLALRALGRTTEANAAFAKAKELYIQATARVRY